MRWMLTLVSNFEENKSSINGRAGADGIVYMSVSGFLASLDKQTGGLEWNVSIDATLSAISNGRILDTSGRTIQAIDPQGGSIIRTAEGSEI